MNDDCIASRHNHHIPNSTDNCTENDPGGTHAVLQTGRLPTSLLKQAMASPKIQKTFQDFRNRSDLPFEENSPSIEMILEHELIEAYENVLGEINEEKNTETNLLLKNAIEIETVCKDFIEEVLAEHLETQLDYLGNKLSEVSNSNPILETSKQGAFSADREPPTVVFDWEEAEDETGGPNNLVRQHVQKIGRTTLLAGLLVGPALAVAVFAKIQSPDKFEGFVDQSLTRTVQVIASLIPGDEKNAASELVAAYHNNAATRTGSIKETNAAAQSEVRDVTQNPSLPDVIPRDVTIASIKGTPSIVSQVQPIVREVDAFKGANDLDEQSIITSKLKTYRTELARLEKLLINPNQPKREEIEALVNDKQETIARLEAGSAKVAVTPIRQIDDVRQADIIVTGNTQTKPGADIMAFEADPAPTVTRENIKKVSFTRDQQKNLQTPEFFKAKFVDIISIRQLPEEQRFALAEQLAKGECLVPAVKSTLIHVPALVMRDLVLTLPDHC